MKYRLYIYIIGVVMSLAACELEHSDNGQLDGLWQMSAVDTLLTGGTRDMRESQRWWGVQGSVVQMRLATSGNDVDDILFRFSHEGDVLRLSEPYLRNRDRGDVKVDDVSLLTPFGITRIAETFRVMELSSSRMTLESDVLRLHFRKY